MKRKNEKGYMFLYHNKGLFLSNLVSFRLKVLIQCRENDKGDMFLYHNKGIFS